MRLLTGTDVVARLEETGVILSLAYELARGEGELQWMIKQTGDKWNRERRLWEVRDDRVVEREPEDRIESNDLLIDRSICRWSDLLVDRTIYL